MSFCSLTLAMLALLPFAAPARDSDTRKDSNIQVGVRPFFLVEGMDNSPPQRFRDCTPRRAAAVPGAHQRVV
jgi:hypothetical protein